MGKLKGILSIAEAATSAGQRGAKVRNLDGAGNVIADLNKTTTGGTPDLPPLEVGRPTEIRAEISQAEETAEQLNRAHHIQDANADPIDALYYQTSTPEEFAERYRGQLVDPAHSVKAVNAGRIPDEHSIMRQETKRAKYENQSSLLRYRLDKNSPRWASRVKQWGEGTPYDFDIMYHVDRTSNPLDMDDLIQYSKPRELGVHAGTNDAAEAMISRYGMEDVLQRGDEGIGAEIEELAGLLDMPASRVEGILGREINEAILRKFDASLPPTIRNEEWVELLDRVGTRLGRDEAGEVERLLSRIKAMPTPNTTPTVFRGKNGLLLQDTGGFGPAAVAEQLEVIFPADVDKILAARTGGVVQSNKNLQEFIESKGFDHVVYHNGGEDKGQLSIINWNRDLMKSVYHEDFVGTNPGQGAAAATAAFMAIMGVGSANIRED